jgi:hypothetical protein
MPDAQDNSSWSKAELLVIDQLKLFLRKTQEAPDYRAQKAAPKRGAR